MSEKEVTTEVTPEGADPRKTAPLAALVDSVLAKREAALLEGIERDIVKLAETPDRSVASTLTPDGPVQPGRGNGSALSRNQPLDGLYRNYLRSAPEYKGCRDADQDHWNTEWLRALHAGDVAMQKMARVKSDECFQRANLLEGTLDASDPTALTGGSGSGLLPQSHSQVVEVAKQSSAVLAPLCQNFQASGLTMRVPTIGAVTAVTAAEGAAPAEANPTVANVMMILTKLGARVIMSDELFMDSAFNVMEIAGRRVGEGIGELEDTQILTTDGASPNITGALVGGAVTEATATELGYYDLATLFFAVPKAYQGNGTWIAGTVVSTLLTNLTDGNGRQVLQTLPAPMGPVGDVSTPTSIGSIFGRPVYHVPSATAGDLIFGDLRNYGWVARPGIEAKVSTEVGFATDTIQFKFTERADGQLLHAGGIKELQGLTSAV